MYYNRETQGNFKKDFLFIIKKTFKTDSKCEVSVTHAHMPLRV